MKVEIWSDILCPWCFIGKREFENALAGFKHKNGVEVIFKSYELDPSAAKEYDGNLYDLLASKYNVSIDRAKEMTGALVERAKATGLTYNMDIAKATNSFDAHRLIHLAATQGLQRQVIELLSTAYLTDGKNISQQKTLITIGVEAGLTAEEITIALNSNAFADAVRKDEYEARNLGIRGVPFFLIDSKYSISGAQPKVVFEEALEKIWAELYPGVTAVANDGAACDANGTCETN